MRTKILIAAVLATLIGFLSACGDEAGDKPATEAELKALLADVEEELGGAKALDVGISTGKLPEGINGLLSASGTATKAPAFKGSATVGFSGAQIDTDVVAVNGKVYANPFGPWMEFGADQLERYGLPDLATIFGDNGMLTLLSATEDLAEGDKIREGEDIVREVTGTIDGAKIAHFIPSANPDTAYDITYRLDGDELKDFTISGPFYGGAKIVTYTVRLSALAKATAIEPPT